MKAVNLVSIGMGGIFIFIFTERLKALRIAKGVTQKQAGIAIGSSERGFQDYERGVSKPGFDALIALANYFEVSLDYLVGLTDDPRPLN